MVKECKLGLAKLSRHNRVKLQWIPAHIGVEGNEAADTKAKEGVGIQIIGPEPIIPISIACCKAAKKRWIQTKHQLRWTNLTTCRTARRSLPTVGEKSSREALTLNRQSIRLVLQVVTGHGNLAKHKNTLDGRHSAICPKCELETETSEHYVGRCPAFTNSKWSILNTREATIEEIISSQGLGKLARFLKRTGRLLEYPG